MNTTPLSSRALHRSFPSSTVARCHNPSRLSRVLRWLWLQM
jgi:hypothetical protein